MNITTLETTPSVGKDKNQPQRQQKKKALTSFILQFLAFRTLSNTLPSTTSSNIAKGLFSPSSCCFVLLCPNIFHIS